MGFYLLFLVLCRYYITALSKFQLFFGKTSLLPLKIMVEFNIRVKFTLNVEEESKCLTVWTRKYLLA